MRERLAPRFARRFVGQRAKEAPRAWFRPRTVVVAGPPWDTVVMTRLAPRGRLVTGAPEENDP